MRELKIRENIILSYYSVGSAQFEGDDSLTGNASLGNSIGAVER